MDTHFLAHGLAGRKCDLTWNAAVVVVVKHGLYAVDVKADGDCLLYSALVSTGRDPALSHIFRHLVAVKCLDTWEANPSLHTVLALEIQEPYQDPVTSAQAYFDAVSRGAVYKDGIVVRSGLFLAGAAAAALAVFLGVNLCIIDVQSDGTMIYHDVPACGEGAPLVYIMRVGEHYLALKRRTASGDWAP